MSPTDDLPDDDLVSAVLDGEADAPGRARVLGDAALTARLDDFAAVQRAVRALDVDPAAADAAREAALAAFFAAPASDADAPGRATVTTLAGRRRPTRLGGARVLGAAAAVIVAVVGFAALGGRSGDDSSGDSAATRAESASTFDAASPEAGGASPAITGASGATARDSTGKAVTGTDLPLDLGSSNDVDALARAFRAAMAPTLARPPSTPSAAPTGAAAACATSAQARATLAGRAVVLQAAADVVTVADATTCGVVATFPVAGPASG